MSGGRRRILHEANDRQARYSAGFACPEIPDRKEASFADVKDLRHKAFTAFQVIDAAEWDQLG